MSKKTVGNKDSIGQWEEPGTQGSGCGEIAAGIVLVILLALVILVAVAVGA